ncbi:MAG: flagellar basal body-associated FliL family protein [Solirubrobacteraceae bacterium]
MASKLKIVVPVVLLLVLGGVYKFVLAKPEALPTPKIAGTVYVLPKEFLVNLAEGRFAKLGVALILDPKDHSLADAAAAGGAHGAAPKPPEGFGPLPQEAVIRDIVTDTLTDRANNDLIDREGREGLKKRIIRAITKRTDVHVEDVLFTDVAVQ